MARWQPPHEGVGMLQERIRQKSAGSYSLSVRTYDEDGKPVTVTDPALSIADGGGTVVHEGSATATSGQLTASVAVAELAELDIYRCTWTGTEGSWHSVLELVGGYLFETAELRAFDPAVAQAEEIVKAARTAAEIRLERAARLAFVPRPRRLVRLGQGSARLRLADNAVARIVSVTVDGVAMTQDELGGLVVQEWGALDQAPGLVWAQGAVVEVHYVHGLDFPPAPVSQAAMVLAREYLFRSALSSRATVEQTDVGFFRLSTAGPDRPIGIPEVDAVVREFGRRRPLVA